MEPKVKCQRIVLEAFCKTVEIVLEARLPALSSPTVQRQRDHTRSGRDKKHPAFNLNIAPMRSVREKLKVLKQNPHLLVQVAFYWNRQETEKEVVREATKRKGNRDSRNDGVSDSTVVERSDKNMMRSSSSPDSLSSHRLLLERWAMEYQPKGCKVDDDTPGKLRVLYREIATYLRSLISYVRLLPAYNLSRYPHGGYISYEIRTIEDDRDSPTLSSSLDALFGSDAGCSGYRFEPIVAPFGTLFFGLRFRQNATLRDIGRSLDDESRSSMSIPVPMSDRFTEEIDEENAPRAHRIMATTTGRARSQSERAPRLHAHPEHSNRGQRVQRIEAHRRPMTPTTGPRPQFFDGDYIRVGRGHHRRHHSYQEATLNAAVDTPFSTPPHRRRSHAQTCSIPIRRKSFGENARHNNEAALGARVAHQRESTAFVPHSAPCDRRNGFEIVGRGRNLPFRQSPIETKPSALAAALAFDTSSSSSRHRGVIPFDSDFVVRSRRRAPRDDAEYLPQPRLERRVSRSADDKEYIHYWETLPRSQVSARMRATGLGISPITSLSATDLHALLYSKTDAASQRRRRSRGKSVDPDRESASESSSVNDTPPFASMGFPTSDTPSLMTPLRINGPALKKSPLLGPTVKIDDAVDPESSMRFLALGGNDVGSRDDNNDDPLHRSTHSQDSDDLPFAMQDVDVEEKSIATRDVAKNDASTSSRGESASAAGIGIFIARCESAPALKCFEEKSGGGIKRCRVRDFDDALAFFERTEKSMQGS